MDSHHFQAFSLWQLEMMFDRSSERKVKSVAVGHKNQDEQEMLNSRVAVAATVEVDDNFSTG